MTIYIPTPLRAFTAGKDALEVSASTVQRRARRADAAYPDLRKHLFTERGKLRAFVNIYLNDEDVRYLPEKDATKVSRDRHAFDHSLDRRRMLVAMTDIWRQCDCTSRSEFIVYVNWSEYYGE